MTIQAKTSLAALALLATLGLGASGAAQAHGGNDIFWSIDVASPGVRVGVSNGQVIVQPPVIYAPPPVIVAPRVVYGAPVPVYYAYPQYRHRRGWERRGWERDDDDDRGYRRGGYERGGEGRWEGRGYGGGEYRSAPPLGRR